MFKRKIEKELIEWKNSLSFKRKAFVLKGLRQVGKTKSITTFAEQNYANVVYINFKLQPDMKAAFDGNLKVDTLVTNITALDPKANFVPHQTVLILDEIQECSGARASIKAFVEDDDRYDVIASGSLLGIKGYNQKYRGGASVGYEHTVYMKPMDFEEFLWAIGINEDVIADMRERFLARKPIDDPIHKVMLRYFKEYMIVGGMPAVVDVYVRTKDFNRTRKEQRDILEGYQDDYGKHLNDKEEEEVDLTLLSRINKVYRSIPGQLAKENKKFMYSVLGKKATSSQFDPAVQWLVDYGLITYCKNLRLLESPLSGNAMDECFKIYVADTGLFMAMLDPESAGDVLFKDMGIYKGALYENIVADAFSKMERELFYFNKDNHLEVDFITRYNRNITLVEVKATTGNTKSSKSILENKDRYPSANQLIKLGEYNISEVVDNLGNIKITMPYYLTFLLKE